MIVFNHGHKKYTCTLSNGVHVQFNLGRNEVQGNKELERKIAKVSYLEPETEPVDVQIEYDIQVDDIETIDTGDDTDDSVDVDLSGLSDPDVE